MCPATNKVNQTHDDRDSTRRRAVVAATLLLFGVSSVRAGDPVALRIENFTVPPATGPLAFVVVKNQLDEPYAGSVSLTGPDGWRIVPPQRDVQLAAGEVARVAFNVEKAGPSSDNSYECRAEAVGQGAHVVHRRAVAVASAPYFKPTIDGDPADWRDAIPVSFVSGGKTTVVRTFWNRRSLSLLVEVEEDKLRGQDSPTPEGAFDAVQLAVAPAGAVTPMEPNAAANRFEFLLCAVSAGPQGACYRLLQPGDSLTQSQRARPLAPLVDDAATVAVRRTDRVTYYECSLPMKPMRDSLRPSEGREFCFSLLVHDPDGSGIRDWGAAAGLWPWQRSRLAWSRWPGAPWPDQPPYDSKTPWGMCSSKY